MSNECDNLDAYLADDLLPALRERFEGHLVVCETCRETVNQQGWIDALLCSPERLELEPVPPVLMESVRDSIALHRRKARLVACGLAAAAVLLVAVGWTATLNLQARIPAVNEFAEVTVKESEPSPNPTLHGRGTAEAPRATFVGGPDVLAVPVASRHPNVTIVRLYPTYKSSPASQAASDDADADLFNGG
jgi:hypothetical protein